MAARAAARGKGLFAEFMSVCNRFSQGVLSVRPSLRPQSPFILRRAADPNRGEREEGRMPCYIGGHKIPQA